MSDLKGKIRHVSQRSGQQATVISIMGDRVNVRLSTGGGRVLHGLRMVGGPVKPGDTVTVSFQDGIPYITSESTGVGAGGAGNAYIAYAGAPIGGETPPGSLDPLTQAGWVIDQSTGVIAKNGIYINPAGSFRVGDTGTGITDFHGFWVGKDGGSNYDLAIGNHDGNNLIWDGSGSSLAITGSVTATTGTIGGWTLGANRLYTTNAYLDSGTASPDTYYLSLGATPPTSYGNNAGIWIGYDTNDSKSKLSLYTDSSNYLQWDGGSITLAGTAKSGDYVAGVSGWIINQNGDAEFENVNVRGTLRSIVFEYGAIQATSGTLGIFKSAGVAYASFTTPASLTDDWTSSPVNFRVKNVVASTFPFADGDTLRVKTLISGAVKGFWITIASHTTYTDYSLINVTATWSGDTSTTFPEGVAVVDYGTSGTGYIMLSTDTTYGASPNISMATIDSAIPASSTLYARIGNLDGSYGLTGTHWGAGFGNYDAASQNSILINGTDGTIDFYNDATSVINIGTSGSIIIGTATGNNTYITSTSIELRYGTITYIKLDNSGNALFGRDGTGGGTYANAYWNASNSRLEFRTNTTPKSYIDTDGAYVISLPASYTRTSALVFNQSGTDTCVLDAYGGSASHVVELRALSVASHYGAVTISANAPTTYGAYVMVAASDVDYSATLQMWADGKSECQITAGATVISGDVKLANSSCIYYGTDTNLYRGAANVLQTDDSLRLSTSECIYFGTDTRFYRGWADCLRVEDLLYCDNYVESVLGYQRYANSTTYTGYIFVPYTTPKTSTYFDGDAYGDTSKTIIDMSTVFGIPAGVQAVLVRCAVRDSGSAGTDCYMLLAPNNTAGEGVCWRPYGRANDTWEDHTDIVPCDANGDLYYQIEATSGTSFDVFIYVWGYWI